MKNQMAKFTCGTDDTLVITASKSKKQIKVTVKTRDGVPGSKAKMGPKDYFELTEEKKALDTFDDLVKKAQAKGWTLTEKAERAPAFKEIPDAPKPKSNGSGVKPPITNGTKK